MKTVSGQIMKNANVREKVTYGYLVDSLGVKYDLIAFKATQPFLAKRLGEMPLGESVTFEGRVVDNDKSKFAVQFIVEREIKKNDTSNAESGAFDMEAAISALKDEIVYELSPLLVRNNALYSWLKDSKGVIHPSPNEEVDSAIARLHQIAREVLALDPNYDLKRDMPLGHDGEIYF